MKKQIKYYSPRSKRLEWIEHANGIFDEFSEFNLTLRQLHYQFVSRNLYENTHANYKTLGNTMSDAREGGLVDWDNLSDRTRVRESYPSSGDPTDYMLLAASCFTTDMWAEQPRHIEVMVEKQALEEVVKKAVDYYRVPYMSSRGYISTTAAMTYANRFDEKRREGKTNILLYLGDHDPTGMHIPDDLRRKLYSYNKGLDPTNTIVKRIALTKEQIDVLKPPANETKEQDNRFKEYYNMFGQGFPSYELDAVNPRDLVRHISTVIDGLIDKNQWNKDIQYETDKRNEFIQMIET